MSSCLLTSVAYSQGTGTKIGDREEMAALAATIGQSHSAENKLIVGSVKSNVGRLPLCDIMFCSFHVLTI